MWATERDNIHVWSQRSGGVSHFTGRSEAPNFEVRFLVVFFYFQAKGLSSAQSTAEVMSSFPRTKCIIKSHV